MRYRAPSLAQRTRRFLTQEAMKRAHRRCDLIRVSSEAETTAPSPHAPHGLEPITEPNMKPFS